MIWSRAHLYGGAGSHTPELSQSARVFAVEGTVVTPTFGVVRAMTSGSVAAIRSVVPHAGERTSLRWPPTFSVGKQEAVRAGSPFVNTSES
jgi:hypothetical protein